ncbi:RING-H2 finger protein ATL3-like [Neltuma alba]|uniref:RING-H2 finger protein ATL3-like n=1 Tax=Neltuma alba TaxID=207710 RepID=UPI0010A42BF6|nr:RING-H2 finger protein ATL3-like [Prosopis alba]
MGDSLVSNDKLGESPAVEVTGKIMVLAIIILFMVVIFVLFLHLYAKWFWWSIEETTPPPPRRRRRRRFVFAPGQDPAIYGGQRSGLDPSVLLSLPVLVYQPENFKDGLECAVCLSELVEGEKARLLPKCNHGFHVDCIDMWFQSHSTCPLCRNPVASEPSKCNSSSSVRENSAENIGSQSQAAENFQNSALAAMGGSESPNFPTNVLVWGNQTQVSSINTSSEEEGPSSSSTTASSSSNNRRHEMMVIDIPSETNSSSLSPSASRFAEDELKSPMTTRLRSLKRLLSRDKRLGPCNPGPGSIDVEQAGRGQS